MEKLPYKLDDLVYEINQKKQPTPLEQQAVNLADKAATRIEQLESDLKKQ